MRMIFGMILGSALTIGAAYVADNATAQQGNTIVNWNAASAKLNSVIDVAQEKLNDLIGG